jgi:hypothetical protein
MRSDEIGDVDVVADTGAVRRRVIGAVELQMGPAAERGLCGDFDEMRGFGARLAGAALRIYAGDIE